MNLPLTSSSKYYLEGRDTEGIQCYSLYLKLPINSSNTRGFVRQLRNWADISVGKLQAGIWNRKMLFVLYDLTEHRLGKTNCTGPTKTARVLGTHTEPPTQRVTELWPDPAVDAPTPHTDDVIGGNGLPCPERSTVFLCPVLPSKSSIVYLPLSCGVGSLICNQICSPVTPVFTRSVNLIWVSLKNTQQCQPFILLEYKCDLLMMSP